jgi:hypothetical protein
MSYQCECLFTTSDRDDFTDHILEAFNPKDDIGADGQVHHERADRTRECACGFTANQWSELDRHLLAVFVPPNGVGQDGLKHTTSLPAMTS